jgi:TetR/AcrR family transcriptional regulator, cholesterol catabolism regulator
VPRIAEAREAAAPSSPSQLARHRRILRVAADLAAEKGLDGVQMHEVAKDAGVAIGTLYRYFPSKVYLFTAIQAEQVDRLDAQITPPQPGQSPVDAVYDVLVTATRGMFRRPTLAQALLQAQNSAHAAKVPEAGRTDRTTRDMLLRAMGITEPTAQDVTAVWLLMQCWYGLLTSALNGRTSLPDVEADLRVACRLLLAGRGSARADAEIPMTGKGRLSTELAG